MPVYVLDTNIFIQAHRVTYPLDVATSFWNALKKLAEVEKKALFIAPSIVEQLTSPGLIRLLMDHPNSILIIEDAETVLMKRGADNSNSVANLLNLTDGFPADFLNLNIIGTFNTGLEEIDPALLREGRLKGIQKFGKLPLDNAIQVAQAIGVDIEIEKPMTVAEICNPKVENRNFYSTTVGFN